jgi:undecaprenyl-diphosphatase
MTESSFSQHPPVQKQNRKADWRLSFHIEIRLLWAGIFIFASCIFLIGYADPSLATYVKTVDQRVYRFFRVITSLGNSAVYLIPFGILCIILRLLSFIPGLQPKKRYVMKGYHSFLFVFSSIAISGVITDIFKFLFGRARPTLLFKDNYYGFAFFEFSSDMWSFPSGHTNTIFALATALFFLLPKGWLLYFSVAVLVGASRVFTGSHYPSDVIAGSYLAVLTTLYIKQYFVFKKIDVFEKLRYTSQEEQKKELR